MQKRKKEQQTELIGCIKLGNFEFKAKNFWLSVLGFFLLFWLGLAVIMSFTVYKILDNYKEIVVEKIFNQHSV